MKTKPSFIFGPNISPRYIRSLFLQLDFGIWYSTTEMKDLLRLSGLTIEGKDIVDKNAGAWALLRLLEKKNGSVDGGKKYYKLSSLGKELQETYSTNQELFFDIMHYLMYSLWHRSKNPSFGKFWLYASVCKFLWDNAPGTTDSYEITGILQNEAQSIFMEYEPKFPARSITAVYTWLSALTPPFLSKETNRPQLFSKKRESCSPQLFHLALDLLYCQKKLKYGTSIAIGEDEVKDVCRTCLLDESRFWEMADRTKMIIRGVDIRRGQFSTSIALEMKPQWIDLPDYTQEIEFEGLEGEEE